MRPNTVVAQREGSLGGSEHKMMFDENSVAHLMSVLTDLYSDPELAVIREYSTNGLDSQIAAGVIRPIEVTTPNPLSPFFKVKDYGLGMDADDIENIYSKYGASTKRDSDTVVGMLGLGCKSALTYTNQFTLNSIKNGMKHIVAISRTEDGSGVMEIVDSVPTDEPNGVEVVVPVKRHHEFERKSNEFFRFWKPGSVLVNGKEPAYITGNPIAENIILVKDLNADYVVMGNVAYPLDDAHSLSGYSYYKRYGIVATIEIGSVNFTPSRESLHYTRRTEATLTEIKKTVSSRMPVAVQEHIDAQEDAYQGWKAYRSWVDLFGGRYGGSQNVPSQFNYRGVDYDQFISHDMMAFDLMASKYAVQGTSKVSYSDVVSRPIVFGYDKDKIAPAHREKMREWERQQEVDSRRHGILVCNEKPEIPDWLPVTFADWEDVRKIKVQRAASTPRQAARFEIFDGNITRHLTKDEIAALAPAKIILAKPGNNFGSRGRALAVKLTPGVTAAILAYSRWESFKKSFPQAVSLTEYLNDLLDETRDSLTEDDKTFLSLGYRMRTILGSMDAGKIDDPRLSTLVTFVRTKTVSATVQRYTDAMAIYYDVSGVVLRNNLNIRDGRDALADYPLVDNVNSENISDAYLYINAKYATMNK